MLLTGWAIGVWSVILVYAVSYKAFRRMKQKAKPIAHKPEEVVELPYGDWEKQELLKAVRLLAAYHYAHCFEHEKLGWIAETQTNIRKDPFIVKIVVSGGNADEEEMEESDK